MRTTLRLQHRGRHSEKEEAGDVQVKTMNDVINIFENIPDHIPEELFQEILKTENIKVERIVSKGHSSEDDCWYIQEENEWVILLKGSAGLLFEGNEEVTVLESGDYINIPSHTKHRVEWTDPDTETVWLAIHYKGEG